MRTLLAVGCVVLFAGCGGDESDEVKVAIEGMPGVSHEAMQRGLENSRAEEAEETARRSDEAAATAELEEWIKQWYFEGKFTSDRVSSISIARSNLDNIASNRDLTEAGQRAARIRDKIDAAMDAARETAMARESAAGERPTGRQLNEEESDKLLADMDAALVD